MCRRKEEVESLLRKAEVELDKAYETRLRVGTILDTAFDLLRKAQLMRVQGRWREARNLRNRAREMFGDSPAVMHIDLKEARLAVQDGEIRMPGIRAADVLGGWERFKYAKGMADALRVLGDIQCIQGDLDKALEHYVAALCVFPFGESLANRLLWSDVANLRLDIARHSGREGLERLVRRMVDRIGERQGCFRHISSIRADRESDIVEIIARLMDRVSEKP